MTDLADLKLAYKLAEAVRRHAEKVWRAAAKRSGEAQAAADRAHQAVLDAGRAENAALRALIDAEKGGNP